MIALLIAAGVSAFVSVFGTWILRNLLGRGGISQPILSKDARGPGHEHKAGTPTMGGVAIIGAALSGYIVAHLRRGVIFTNTGLIVLFTIVAAAMVGFLDDYIKVVNRRNLGLSKRAKSWGLLIVAIMFCVLLLWKTTVHTTLGYTRWTSTNIDLHGIGWSLLAIAMIYATSNAFNLTDGLDGLAAGSALYALVALTIISFWGFRHPQIYGIAHALDISVVGAAMIGGCAGFLWWNAAPADIFMGDTGSLGIGTALACMAIVTNTHLLLPLVCGLYVVETGSVLLQMTSYKYFGKRRIFRMSPIHHHFELAGWPETKIIIRFWMFSGLCAAIALGLYYADFIAAGGLD
ncbi:MAG: phospho-N-acetylmuramoyl-pentapeptide-transferase [Acidimicrobiia bacterium]